MLEPRQQVALPLTTYQLAEQYHAGAPIALYQMQPRWTRFCQGAQRVLLGAVICTMVFLFTVFALFLYQYFFVYAGQIPDLQERLMLSLPGTIVGFMGCIGCLIMRNIIVQRVPCSFLVCTEGLVGMYSKRIEVTYWDEVQVLLQEPRSQGKKLYRLNRRNRQALFFGPKFCPKEWQSAAMERVTERLG